MCARWNAAGCSQSTTSSFFPNDSHSWIHSLDTSDANARAEAADSAAAREDAAAAWSALLAVLPRRQSGATVVRMVPAIILVAQLMVYCFVQ
jgi:hypothetical protein